MLRRLWFLAYLLPALAVALGLLLEQETPGAHRVPEPRFDGAAAWSFLERLVALGPRYEPEARRKAADLVEDEVETWGASRVRSVPCARGEGRTGRSITAEFPGEGPRAKEEIVILGHFDTVPDAPGALDDGSGPALLAGLARALKGRALERTVILAAVDMEEQGLVGARALASEQARAGDLDHVRAAISLEMLGWKDGVPVLHAFPTGFWRPADVRPPAGGLAPRWLAALVLAAARDAGRPTAYGDRWVSPVYQVVFRHFVTPFDSDCGAYVERGVPALFLSDCSFTSFYPQYHKPGDTIAEVDRAKLDEAGRALEALVLALAARPATPRAESGPMESETDYLALGGRVLSGWALRIAVLLGTFPFVLRALARKASAAALMGTLVAGASCAGAALAPVTAFVVLLVAWLAAPTLLSQSRAVRVLGTLLILAPLLAVAGTIGAAMASFQRVVPPSNAVVGLVICAVVPILLALLSLASPRERDRKL